MIDPNDPELIAERAAILAVENDYPAEEAEALARFWLAWTPADLEEKPDADA